MSYAATEEAEDRYYTQVDAGDVRLFTLDQLDAAFNAGLIHENTYVCLEGDSQWLTLAEVAGLGEDEPEAAPAPAPVPHYTVPAAQTALPYSSSYNIPPSIAPVVNDLALDDFDPDMMAMRPKRRAGKLLAGIAVLSLAGLGFGVVSSGGLSAFKLPALSDGAGQASAASLSLSNAKNGESSPAPAKWEPPRAAVQAPKAPSLSEIANTPTPDEAKKSDDDRFSEEMKAALLAKDEKQAASHKQRKATRASVARQRPGKAKASGNFKASGSAYDPLNGKL